MYGLQIKTKECGIQLYTCQPDLMQCLYEQQFLTPTIDSQLDLGSDLN